MSERLEPLHKVLLIRMKGVRRERVLVYRMASSRHVFSDDCSDTCHSSERLNGSQNKAREGRDEILCFFCIQMYPCINPYISRKIFTSASAELLDSNVLELGNGLSDRRGD